jgi:hypothetical protein
MVWADMTGQGFTLVVATGMAHGRLFVAFDLFFYFTFLCCCCCLPLSLSLSVHLCMGFGCWLLWLLLLLSSSRVVVGYE